MSLKEILEKMIEKGEPVLLNDGHRDWEVSVLLENLSGPRLKTQAHLQPGLYIAEINASGYLGQVLYRVKPKV